MIHKLILSLALVLTLGLGVASAQRSVNSSAQLHTATYEGNDTRSFQIWLQKELKEDFDRLKSNGVKVGGTILVRYEVGPQGRVGALKHEELKSKQPIDNRVTEVINRVLVKQKWTFKGIQKPKVREAEVVY